MTHTNTEIIDRMRIEDAKLRAMQVVGKRGTDSEAMEIFIAQCPPSFDETAFKVVLGIHRHDNYHRATTIHMSIEDARRLIWKLEDSVKSCEAQTAARLAT